MKRSTPSNSLVLDRHTKQGSLNRGYVIKSDIPFTRVLDHDNAPRKSYQRRKGEVKTVLHWGQRKLMLSELEFLSLYVDPEKSEDFIVLYAGAAPGSHIPFLAELFPKVKFVLVDPRPFTISSFVKKRDELKDRIEIHIAYFTDDMAREWQKKSEENGKQILFISDIRTSEDADNSAVGDGLKVVAQDMVWQRDWHNIMKTTASMFKFRLPWGKGTTEYLNGRIFLPVWGPITTTECRLIVENDQNERTSEQDGNPIDNNKSRERIYDHAKYEEQMFHFNTIQRIGLYENPCNSYYQCRCYDCTSEARILQDYIKKFKYVGKGSKAAAVYGNGNANGNGNGSQPGDDTVQSIAEIASLLDEHCSRDKLDPRTIFQDNPDAEERKTRINKRQKIVAEK